MGTPVVCDPGLESEVHVASYHFADETQCETSCTIGHPNNPCKFFTWVPHTQAAVPNCYQMKACNKMVNPIMGSRSGAWNCEDPEIFCEAIGDIPAYDDKKTYWTCDHNIHPYGDATKKIFQDTTCRTTCPSYTYQTHGTKGDPVVSSECIWDPTEKKSVWSSSSPDNVIDSSGVLIESAATNPTPACGCQDLVLPGTVQDEEGKVFQCREDPDIVDGNTVITEDNECALVCDGTLVFDLYCSAGQWSVDYLTTAEDIYCYGGGTTGGYVTLSTFWPPAPTDSPTTTTTTPAADTTPPPTPDSTTPLPADSTTPAPVDSTTPPPADNTTEGPV